MKSAFVLELVRGERVGRLWKAVCVGGALAALICWLARSAIVEREPKTALYANGRALTFNEDGRAEVVLPRQVFVGRLPTNLHFELILANHEPAPVSIVAVDASCGCSRPRFRLGPLEVGETVSAEVEIVSERRMAETSHSATVHLGDGRRIITRLPYAVYPSIQVHPSPDMIELRGSFCEESTASVEVSVFQTVPAGRPELHARDSTETVLLELEGPLAIRSPSEGLVREDVFQLHLRSREVGALVSGILTLSAATKDGFIGKSEVLVRSRTVRPFVVYPTYLKIKPGAPGYVTVRRLDGESLEAVGFSAEGVQARLEPFGDDPRVARFEVSCVDSEATGTEVVNAAIEVIGMTVSAALRILVERRESPLSQGN